MIKLRKVTMEDAENLLKWKNEEDTRKNSIVTDALILMEDHVKWLEKTLADANVDFYIIENEGAQLGDVRVERKGAESEISIRMDVSSRGAGLATQIIGLFRGALMAKIRVHNLASMRVFIANGYRPNEYVAEPVPYLIFRK